MTFLRIPLRVLASVGLFAGSLTAWAQSPATAAPATSAVAQAEAVRVTDAWARASVPGQKATGAFMTLTAATPMQLVGVATDVAGVAEVHEMAMQGEVMRMRAIGSLALPAGKPVELKPGGYHLMLMDLKHPLKAGETVPLTLTWRDAQGQESRTDLKVPVRAAATAPASPGHGGGHKH
ncbi:copper chaperone PCu(A)C [Ottowia sp. GY511]|uniref:Copper chaperone PCu(A)C n=1 Tax=Ottowia flava TaxID=2675430 RepID=A0ABW4KR27_9BURK|nr:copper chaperone PCu(A)C [Ottowia sp. GY511]TXK30969.1 copper chaperone PCu(A)C [Ottowia sp. GY511]